MMFSRTGFILYVTEYLECVAFYRDLLELPVLFETPALTCFEFGSSYLMVEQDDEDPLPAIPRSHTTCLRMNVENVRTQADRIAAQGIKVDYREHAWGTIAKFADPAGNLCAFKDDARFEQQVRDHTL